MDNYEERKKIKTFLQEFHSLFLEQPFSGNLETRIDPTIFSTDEHTEYEGHIPNGTYDTYFHAFTNLDNKETGMVDSFILYHVREEDGKQYFEVTSSLKSQNEKIVAQRVETSFIVSPTEEPKDLIPLTLEILDQHHVTLQWSFEQKIGERKV